ncbi:hypothetical protein ACOSQ2_024124 [Xanthoceras sorbifolium]
MKSGESVIDYFSWMMAIVNKIRIHGEKSEDVTIVEKILRPQQKINRHSEEIEDEAEAEFECRTNLNKQNGERTNYAEKEEEVSLLMVCYVNEKTQQNMWYLDIGCRKHMCGDKRCSLT